MSIKHKRIAGTGPATDPAKCGGDDWDEPHVYSPGASFIALRGQWTMVSGSQSDRMYLGYGYIDYDGPNLVFEIHLDPGQLPIRAGDNYTARAMFTVQTAGSTQNRIFWFDGFTPETGLLTYAIDSAFTGTVYIDVLVTVTVLSAGG